jgi:hypothetical protein
MSQPTFVADQAIKWAALGEEALVAFGAIAIVGAAGLIIIGVSRASSARQDGQGGASALGGVSLALLGAVICVAALALGFIAMVHKSS